MSRDRWNKKYLARGPAAFGGSPASSLTSHQEELRSLLPGHALDLACGNGKNSFFLAELGFEMDAVDVSDVAIDYVQQEAGRRNLPVRGHCLDLEKEAFPRPEYDLIICFRYLQRSSFEAISAALRPGGLLLYETFYRDEKLAEQKMNPAYLLEPLELRGAFPDLQVLDYKEEITGNTALASLLARKQAD